MYVIGTAGHVDHGKSTLVKALTNIDPDRLPEEKEREMTLDLGFAWMELPSGREISIVDVPGHERFIKNMLAGVGAIDLAMLIVAADKSVMPQPREHLAILDILQIPKGLVVVTKTDLVDEEMVELVMAEVEDALHDTSMQGCPLLGVSAYTGAGLPELREQLDRILDDTQVRQDMGRPRLPVDRSFSISGARPCIRAVDRNWRTVSGKKMTLTRIVSAMMAAAMFSASSAYRIINAFSIGRSISMMKMSPISSTGRP